MTERTTGQRLADALAALSDGRDLDPELAYAAMGEFMEGRATEAQMGGFLVGLRTKGETVEEIAAFARAMRDKSVRVTPRVRSSNPFLTDVCGTGGANVKTFNVSTIAAFVAAGAGLPVAKHGNRGVTSPSGSADLLEALGVKLSAPPDVVQRCIEEIGIGFLFAPSFHPAMKYAAPVRKSLGIRTVFNLLGPLTNPAGVQAHLMGVFDPALVEIYPQVLRKLGVKRAIVVHGVDGLDELSTVGVTEMGVLVDGEIRHERCRPESLGFRLAHREEVGPLPPKEGAELACRLLHNELTGPRMDLLVLNAGAAIYAGGGAASLEAGIDRAHASIENGAAFEKLRQLVALTRAES